jgi:DNA-binding MarR family transcriptional regulator
LIACPDFVLSTLSLTVSELIEEALARFDLRLRDYRLLRLLLLDGPQLQGAVGPALRVDRTTVVALVDKVELKKLVRRSRSDTDRRAYLLSLTAKGERVARAATTTVNAVEEDFFAPLDAKERSDLRSLSMRLLAEPGAIANAHAATRRR